MPESIRNLNPMTGIQSIADTKTVFNLLILLRSKRFRQPDVARLSRAIRYESRVYGYS